MRQFGGLKRLMPYTHWTFLIGCLALAGVFPLAGFWSKDAVLGALHDKIHTLEHQLDHGGSHAHAGPHAAEHWAENVDTPPAATGSLTPAQLATARTIYQWLYYSAVLTAFLTAFYTFRAYALTFHGPLRFPPQAGHHAHESPPVMTVPLMVLAACSILVGLVVFAAGGGATAAANGLVDFLAATPSLAGQVIAAPSGEATFHLSVAGLSTLVALAGIGLALFLYLGEPYEANSLQRLLNLEGARRITDPQWVARLERIRAIGALTRGLRAIGLGFLVTLLGYLLGLISLVLSVPLVAFTFLTPYRLSHDKFYFDELYQALVVWPLRLVGQLFAWFDRWVVDGLVNLTGRIPAAAGWVMRAMQMGLVQFYALAMVLGMLILVAARLLWAAG
jgi:NADH-quinone oxidoreductase subunit L